MWLQRTELWQVCLHQHGATATRVDGGETATSEESTRQVSATSALDAWQVLEVLLPAACKLHVYLASDVAKLTLVTGGDALSERDWQALAEARFRGEGVVVLDTRWRAGKRAVLVVDEALLQRIRESGFSIKSIVPSAALMLSMARSRLGGLPGILHVKDAGGWTVAAFDNKNCLALAIYPAAASEEQIAVEALRVATATGLPSHAKRIIVATPPRDMPLQLRPAFAFDLLQSSRIPKVAFALSLVLFLSVVIALTQAWHEIDVQAKAVAFKQRQSIELASAISQAKVPNAQTPENEEPVELRADWKKTFRDLEAVADPGQGVQVTNFNASASGHAMRLTVEVKSDALEKFYGVLRKQTDGLWRVASVSRLLTDANRRYQIILVRREELDERPRNSSVEK